jgi:histone-lysine N-methyltransferase MLL3
MFRLDEDRVIDATLKGGLARYINHCCNPNCVAEAVEVDRDVKIIIFSKTRISRGEEVRRSLNTGQSSLCGKFLNMEF